MTDPILYLSMILGLGGVYVLIASFNDDDDDDGDDDNDNDGSRTFALVQRSSDGP